MKQLCRGSIHITCTEHRKRFPSISKPRCLTKSFRTLWRKLHRTCLQEKRRRCIRLRDLQALTCQIQRSPTPGLAFARTRILRWIGAPLPMQRQVPYVKISKISLYIENSMYFSRLSYFLSSSTFEYSANTQGAKAAHILPGAIAVVMVTIADKSKRRERFGYLHRLGYLNVKAPREKRILLGDNGKKNVRQVSPCARLPNAPQNPLSYLTNDPYNSTILSEPNRTLGTQTYFRASSEGNHEAPAIDYAFVH